MPTYTRNDVAAAIGLIGMVTAVALVASITSQDLSAVWIGPFGLVVLAGGSAWMAGKWVAGLFGHAGGAGWFYAALGAVMATVGGAMIAGTVLFPGLGTIYTPLILCAIGVSTPLVWITWLVCMVGLQGALMKSRD